MSFNKRKRASNFSEEEKLRFLRILQEKGDVIISKVSAHDSRTNRLKEEAWLTIADSLNASGNTPRSTETLKKLWTKLKGDAKTLNSLAFHQSYGTAGEGNLKKLDDPVMDLVIGICGCANSGNESVIDCDPLINANSNDDSHSPPQSPKEGKNFHAEVEYFMEAEQKFNSTPIDLKRKKPQLPNSIDRSVHCNTLVIERISAEKEKRELIAIKKKNEIEFHDLRMQHEKRLFELKEAILEEVLKKLGITHLYLK